MDPFKDKCVTCGYDNLPALNLKLGTQILDELRGENPGPQCFLKQNDQFGLGEHQRLGMRGFGALA